MPVSGNQERSYPASDTFRRAQTFNLTSKEQSTVISDRQDQQEFRNTEREGDKEEPTILAAASIEVKEGSV